MNLSDRLSDELRRYLTRRWFFRDCGVGLGSIALASLLGESAGGGPVADPLAPKKPHFAGQGEARHLPVHGRGPEPSGTVRQQAAARQVRRQAAAGRAAQGLPGRVHQPELEAPRAEVQVRQARQVRGRAVGTAAAPGDRRRRHRHRQVDGHRRVQPRPGPDLHEHRLAAVRPAEPRVVGHLRPGQRVAGPARLRRLQLRAARGRAAARRTGAAASCRRSTRASCSARPATRCCSCPTRRASTTRLQRDSLDAINDAQRDAARRRRRPGDRHAHQLVRDGLPDAGRAPRS